MPYYAVFTIVSAILDGERKLYIYVLSRSLFGDERRDTRIATSYYQSDSYEPWPEPPLYNIPLDTPYLLGLLTSYVSISTSWRVVKTARARFLLLVTLIRRTPPIQIASAVGW